MKSVLLCAVIAVHACAFLTESLSLKSNETKGNLSHFPNVTITEFIDNEDSVNENSGNDNYTTSSESENERVKVVPIPYNSDVIVGQDTSGGSLLLSCTASCPVQWIYSGDGRPQLSTNTSVKFLSDRKSESQIDFTAFAYISSPQEKNTGNYTCRSLQDPRIFVYYFIYVPGPTLFTSSGGHKVFFSRNDPTVRIPCSVSNPKALVGLQKSVNGLLNCPLNESISYSSKTGFHLKTMDFTDPQGIYICSAAYNNSMRYIQFELVSIDADPVPSSPSPSPSPPASSSMLPPTVISTSTTTTTTTEAPTISLTTEKEPEKITDELCSSSSDCPQDKYCGQSGKCENPCENICGVNALCRVINHIPECVCPENHAGDPYVKCMVSGSVTSRPQAPTTTTTSTNNHHGNGNGHSNGNGNQENNPCFIQPSPCGQNGDCKMSGKVLVCSCKQGFYGTPPNCAARGCSRNNECGIHEACIQNQCNNPCITGVCGKNTKCHTINHSPVCACELGYEGDPFEECKRIFGSPIKADNMSMSNFESTTYRINTNQMSSHSDSHSHSGSCKNMKCGLNAQCTVLGDGRAICRCNVGSNMGDPYTSCYKKNDLNVNPCLSSPCGPNTICRDANNGSATCTCMPDTYGNPYVGCRSQNCLVHSECPKNQTCHNRRCQDGCQNRIGNHACGINSVCKTEEHVTYCSCLPGYTGQAERECYPIKIKPTNHNSGSPVQVHGSEIDGESQACQKTSHCPESKVCFAANSTCVDPCKIYDAGCGPGAVCKVINHAPTCHCKGGHSGNPFIQCYKKVYQPQSTPESLKEETVPCYPLPCGSNAVCVMGAGQRQSSCACKTGFYGDPFTGCQNAESCSSDRECPSYRGCVNGRCLDPCKFQGICGINMECRVVNQRASCSCRSGYPIKNHGNCYRDNPISSSSSSSNSGSSSSSIGSGSSSHQQQNVQTTPSRPSHPGTSQSQSQGHYQTQNQNQVQQVQQANCAVCGPNSECQASRGIIACSCAKNMIGSPPKCRPECQYDTDCPFDKACIAFKCQDPCTGACGQNSLCSVRQRTPVCRCPKGYYGNPIYGCKCCDPLRASLQGDHDENEDDNDNDNHDDEEYDEGLFDSTVPNMFLNLINFNQTADTTF